MSEDLDIVARFRDQVTADLKRIQQMLAHVESKSGSAGGALSRLASTAGGVFGGILGAQAFNTISGAITGTVGTMIGMNSELENLQTSFEVLLSDSALATKGTTDGVAEMAGATSTAANSIRDAQERMADAAEDHQLSVAKLAKEFSSLETDGRRDLDRLAKEFGSTMADMKSRHEDTVSDLKRQLDSYNADFAQQSGERRRRFEDEIASRRSRLAEEVADLRRRYAEQAKTAPERFLREKEAAARNAEFLQEAIDAEEAKGTHSDQVLLASLRQRLMEEVSLQNRTFTQFQAAEKVQVDQAVRAAEDRASREENALRGRFEAEERMSSEANARRISDFVRRLGEEDEAYARNVAVKQVKYAEDLTAFKEGETEKLAVIRERQAEEERQFTRTVRDTEQAMATAGASYQKAATTAVQTTGAAVNQMGQMFANLGKLVGRPLETAQDRASAMLEWIKKKAKETPFDLPQVQAAAQRLIAYQLDATEFLDTVGNVASGMNRPLAQVADAFGALATGQMGEAVMRFREFGINLKSIEALKFDAQGALVTPTEQALNAVKKALDERFFGLMEKQSKNWTGIVSNLRDTWEQFLTVVGKPAFKELEKGLSAILAYIDKNAEALDSFGQAIGEQLANAVRTLVPLAMDAIKGLFEWISSGRAPQDVRAMGTEVKNLIEPMARILVAGRAIFTWLDNAGTFWSLTFKTMGQEIEVFQLQVRTVINTVTNTWRDWEKATVAVLDSVDKAFKSLTDGIGVMWQGVQEAVKGAVNGIIEAINGIIRAWNGISFTVPAVDLPFGGRVGGWSVGVQPIGEIPKLGKGGVAMSPTLAIVGDVPEAIVPLSRMGGSGIYLTINVAGSVITERDLALSVRRELLQLGIRGGGNLFGGVA